MLKKHTVAFWRWRNLLQHLSTKDNERNLYKNLLTIENTVANELLERFSFQKFLQTRQTSRNNTKLSKSGFGYEILTN